MHRAIMPGRFWSGSYCACTCGGPPLQSVKDYIENQQRPD
ncbi:transposase [Streptomyces sp. NPDC002573]